MSDIHIDDFYKDAGKILSVLYANFPRKTTLYVEDISGEDSPDEFGLHSERFLSCFSTMVWLEETGYLKFDSTIRQEAIDQATLTHRGFLILASRCTIYQQLRPSLTDENITKREQGEPSASLIEDSHANIILLRAALKSHSSIEIKRCMYYLLSNDLNYR